MKKHIGWSYSPYRPPFIDRGDIYITRVVPYTDSVHFEWLKLDGDITYTIYCKKRDDSEFVCAGNTDTDSFDIKGLDIGFDYEFYVEADGKKSLVRLARTGEVIGTVINYLHPDDTVYAFSGRNLCSPSLVRHPEGYLLASMDVYEYTYPQNLTLIFRSDDNGESWHYVSELFPSFWSKMFIHKGELYVLSCSSEYSDLLIGKSSDGGKSFTEPTLLLRGGNGKNGEAGIHKNPQPVVYFDGRIWNTLEWGSWERGYHAPMVMSADMEADLLDASSWSFSEPVKYNPNWEGVPEGESTGNIEGCLVKIDGGLYNIMRFDMNKMKPRYGKVIAYKVNTNAPEKALEYARCIDFPANHSKFEIKYDDVSGKYYSLADRIIDNAHCGARTLISLMESENGWDWHTKADIINKLDEDHLKIGFQYIDFIIEGEDILFQCRTAMNNATSFHDTNYSTFHRIQNFRTKPRLV